MERRLIINAGLPVLRLITLSDRLLKHPKWLYDLPHLLSCFHNW